MTSMVQGRLAGRIAVVTGAANGIGRASALRLAREGAALALVDREGERLAPGVDGRVSNGHTQGLVIATVPHQGSLSMHGIGEVQGRIFWHPTTSQLYLHAIARGEESLAEGGPLIRVKPGDLAAAGVERVPRTVGVQDGLPVLEDGRVLGVANVVCWITSRVRSARTTARFCDWFLAGG